MRPSTVGPQSYSPYTLRREDLGRGIFFMASAAAPESRSTGISCSSLTCDLDKLSSATTSSASRSEEHTSELQSLTNLVCRLLLEKKKKNKQNDKEGNKSKLEQTGHIMLALGTLKPINIRSVIERASCMKSVSTTDNSVIHK